MDTRGERLRIARAEAGLTQHEVAERFGVDTSTVSRWETGSDPGTDRIGELADLYGVDARWLAFGGERSEEPKQSAVGSRR
jgi:transcriptional regulator with XRE-family HTH domain